MLKKPKKSTEEVSAEGFFPVDEKSKQTTEKEIKPNTPRHDLTKNSLEVEEKEKVETSKNRVTKINKRPKLEEIEVIEKQGTKKKATSSSIKDCKCFRKSKKEEY